MSALDNYYGEFKQLPWDTTYEYYSPEIVGKPAKPISKYKWINELTGSGKLKNPEFLELDKLYIWVENPPTVDTIKVCFKPESEQYQKQINTNEIGSLVGAKGIYVCVTPKGQKPAQYKL